MTHIVVLLFFVLTLSAHATDIKVIYGADNRKDLVEVTNPLYLQLARSTAAMIPVSAITRDEGVKLKIISEETLETAKNVCPGEKFSQQPVASSCSGFLVGKDILVTAGHCYSSYIDQGVTPDDVCRSFDWVFDYAIERRGRNPLKGFTRDDIYSCKSIIALKVHQLHDYAVIKLDRAVVGREPLKMRFSGEPTVEANLVTIGTPSSLPMKVTDGGMILAKSEQLILTNLDTFHGNSGSPVMDASTGIVEGILVKGKNDYRPSILGNANSCLVVNRCDEYGQNCADMNSPEALTPAEIVSRINQVIPTFLLSNL